MQHDASPWSHQYAANLQRTANLNTQQSKVAPDHLGMLLRGCLRICSSLRKRVSCNFLFAAQLVCILFIRTLATTIHPTVRSVGFRARNDWSGVIPISSMRRRSALLLYQSLAPPPPHL